MDSSAARPCRWRQCWWRPSLILWTFAGLETPLLATIITAMATVYSQEETRGGQIASWRIAGMTGAAVLTRYDAVLFAGPVFLAALVEPGWSGRQRLVAAIVAAVAAGAVGCVCMAAVRRRAADVVLHQNADRGSRRCYRQHSVHDRAHGYRRHRRDGRIHRGLRRLREDGWAKP